MPFQDEQKRTGGSDIRPLASPSRRACDRTFPTSSRLAALAAVHGQPRAPTIPWPGLWPLVSRVSPLCTAAVIRPWRGKTSRAVGPQAHARTQAPHQDHRPEPSPKGINPRTEGHTSAGRRRSAAAPLPPCLRHRLRGGVRPSPPTSGQNPAPGDRAQGRAAQQVTEALGYRIGRIAAAAHSGLTHHPWPRPQAGVVDPPEPLPHASKAAGRPHRQHTRRAAPPGDCGSSCARTGPLCRPWTTTRRGEQEARGKGELGGGWGRWWAGAVGSTALGSHVGASL